MSLLEKATGRGLINLSEFEERSATAVAARTRADLNAVLLDLPGLVVSGGPDPASLQRTPGADPGRVQFGAPAGGMAGVPADSSPPTLELAGRGSRDLRGYWVVPARIVIAGSGITRLDFCDAQWTSSTVRVEFPGGRTGLVDLIVPVGTSVRMDELGVRRGIVENRVAPGGRGGRQLVLVGETRGGRIRIRHPRRGLFG